NALHFSQRYKQRAKFAAPVISQDPPNRSLLPMHHRKRSVSSFSLEKKARMRAVSEPHHNQTRTFVQSSRNGIFKSRQTRICCRCSQGIAQGLLSISPRSSTKLNCSPSSVASSSSTIMISPV